MADKTTPRLGLDIWNEPGDYYDHVELYSNWITLDTEVLKRTGDETSGPIIAVLEEGDDVGFGTRLATDSDPRVTVTGEGINWGAGNDDPDSAILRTGTTTLTVTGRMRFSHNTLAPIHGDQDANDAFIENTQAGDDEPLFVMWGDGTMGWGDGTDVDDTYIYRKSPGVLKIVSTLEADNLDTTEISIDGNTIKFEDGALSLEVPFVTDGYIAARNSHPGRVALGDPADPNNAIISFGAGPNASIFMTSSPSLRLKTNNVFQAHALISGPVTATHITADSVKTGPLTVEGSASFGTNLTVSGTLTGQGGSFLGLDVRGGSMSASGTSGFIFKNHVNLESAYTLSAHRVNVGGYLTADWDLTAKHVYVNAGFVRVRNDSFLEVNGPAGFNGPFTVTGDGYVGGSLVTRHLRSQDGVIRAHNQLQPLGGVHMAGQMLIGASVVATDNIRHSSNDPYAYIGFGPIRLVSTQAPDAPGGIAGARVIDLNHGTMVRGGINTMGYNINLGGGQIVGASDEALKHKFRALSDDKFFEAAKTLDVKSWSWKKGDDERHVGPTVQEFGDKFGYGVVDDGLSMMDMIGVLYKLSSVFARKIDALEAKLSQENV